MSFVKAIEHGKEHRKPLMGAKAIFPGCNNHGWCPVCTSDRTYKMRDKHPPDRDEMEDAGAIYVRGA